MQTAIARYGTFSEDQTSTINELGRKTVSNPYRSLEFVMRHHTAGYECAGSLARWTDEKWSVRFIIGGAYHGKSFSTESAAREFFDNQKTV